MVGRTKIECTRAHYIFLTSGHVNSRKSDFMGKTLRTQKFQREIFWRLQPTESLRTHDSENVVCLGDRAKVIAAQSEHEDSPGTTQYIPYLLKKLRKFD